MNGALITLAGAVIAAVGASIGVVMRVLLVERPHVEREDARDDRAARLDEVRALREDNLSLRTEARELREELSQIHDRLLRCEESERMARRDLFAERAKREALERQIERLSVEIAQLRSERG